MDNVTLKLKCQQPKPYRIDVIATSRATGRILQFWNSLLVGDAMTLISIMDDDEYFYLIDAVYDTSDVEEWKSLRFNYRGLSRSCSALVLDQVLHRSEVVTCFASWCLLATCLNLW